LLLLPQSHVRVIRAHNQHDTHLYREGVIRFHEQLLHLLQLESSTTSSAFQQSTAN
jgi:hypothetical protein